MGLWINNYILLKTLIRLNQLVPTSQLATEKNLGLGKSIDLSNILINSNKNITSFTKKKKHYLTKEHSLCFTQKFLAPESEREIRKIKFKLCKKVSAFQEKEIETNPIDLLLWVPPLSNFSASDLLIMALD